MDEPRDLAERFELGVALPAGSEERFAGYGVMGQPFASGHLLALRRFPVTSFGAGYTSIWHRDPAGVWSFVQDAPPERSRPLAEQAQLADVWLPQDGRFFVGYALLEAFDPARHLKAPPPSG